MSRALPVVAIGLTLTPGCSGGGLPGTWELVDYRIDGEDILVGPVDHTVEACTYLYLLSYTLDVEAGGPDDYDGAFTTRLERADFRGDCPDTAPVDESTTAAAAERVRGARFALTISEGGLALDCRLRGDRFDCQQDQAGFDLEMGFTRE